MRADLRLTPAERAEVARSGYALGRGVARSCGPISERDG